MTQNWHIYAICCWPEVAGDVTSGRNLKTIEGYMVAQFDSLKLLAAVVFEILPPK